MNTAVVKKMIIEGPRNARKPVTLLAAFCFIAALLISCTTGWKARRIEVRMQSSTPTLAQLFYSTGRGFNEKQSVKLHVKRGQNHLTFFLPLNRIDALRFDPANNESIVAITNIRAIDLAGNAEDILLDSVRPMHGIHLQYSEGTLKGIPDSANSDPQTTLPVPDAFLHRNKSELFRRACVVVLTLISALLCIPLVLARVSPRLWIPAGMALVLGLILAMASGSPVDHSVHPDEHSHVTAYQYYLTHFSPPEIGNPAVLPSVSKYGSSYLYEWDVVYAVAARVAGPFTSLFGNDVLTARAFNGCLWLGLLLIALAGNTIWRRILVLTLISPQIWYVFSYFNGDAFPLALTFVCAALVAMPNGGVGKFIRHGGRVGIAIPTLVIALGILIVSKRNFIPIVPAMLMWLMVLHLRPRAWMPLALIGGLAILGCAVQLYGVAISTSEVLIAAGLAALLIGSVAAGLLMLVAKHPERRPQLARLTLILLGALIVATPRIAWDLAINGSPASKSQKIATFENAHSSLGFRPMDRSLARSGVGLGQVLLEKGWVQKSSMSAYGVYGYMSIWTPQWIYDVLRAISVLLIILGVVCVIRVYPQTGPALCVVTLGTILLIALSSLMHSWVGDFQPQGRYLLPTFPVIALLLVRMNASWQHQLHRWLVLAAVVVGVYSYAFYALPALACAN